MGGRDVFSQKREDENGLSLVSILALSVTCGDTSPKGRGSGEAGNLAAMPRALPLGELLSGARLRGLALPPLRLAVQAPSGENAMPGGPQTARHCSIKTIFPLFMPKANAAGILICYILIFCAARAMDASSATRRFSSIWPQ